MSTRQSPLDRRIDAIRAFNRFWTRRIGVVRGSYLDSGFSLTEARVLFELAHAEGRAANEIGAALDLDAGYLSRILSRFATLGLVTRAASASDRRRADLRLTETGRAAFQTLDAAARDATGGLLSSLPDPAQERLVRAMATMTRLLADEPAPAWTTRPPAPGDIGWVIERHAALYAAEYGFDHRFEALVAQIASAFLSHNDPAKERCWIAEQAGVRLGSVFLLRLDDETARLRLLIVEPSARGLGIGRGLVRTCVAFARAAGYRRITLGTNDILLAARAIYRAEGFRMIAEEPHADFGPSMVAEEWLLTL